jgi:membrane protease YdiL (CAAX protease family)
VLFTLGCLGPIISSIIVYSLKIDSLGGLIEFKEKYLISDSKKYILLIPFFTIVHYGLNISLNNVQSYGDFKNFFISLPIMLVLFGSQEIGWRSILQPALEVKNGYWKSMISTGLIWSLWFLPLIFIPKFIILPQFYSQFAAYLVGLSFMLTIIYKSSGSILYSSLLSTCIFALYPVIIVKQGFMQVVIVFLEALIVSMVKKKKEAIVK